MLNAQYTLGSEERIKSKKLIDTLFSGGNSRSTAVFPLRAVYYSEVQSARCGVQILVSVSKRHFKRAVDRNRIKRQIRESYRLNKALLQEVIAQKPSTALYVAFIWQADQLYPTKEVAYCMKTLLHRIAEKIQSPDALP